MSTDKTPKDQLAKVFNSFFEFPKTMKEVDVETEIMRENICRYVRTFRKENRIALVGYRRCKITGSDRVGIYSTNPDLFPEPSRQTNIPGQ
ncbi:hypothetical protein [Flavobacterium sp. N2038]|uniref:hypothetical protein n=1 Tax=Flavobacterium sp. N2038 TaxID=2986829 RepID=UPI0022244CB1|nr:hypothetical protein [Flavobacterium sp. N2038]